MPIESRTVAYQANPEKPTSRTLLGFLQKLRTSSQGEFASPTRTHDKMGFMFSKIAKHIGPRTFTAHDSTWINVPTNSDDDSMAPERDEIPSRTGSTSSLERVIDNDVGYHSSLFWPYVSSHAHNDDPDSENPLRLRRPALYEEYWVCEPRPASG